MNDKIIFYSQLAKRYRDHYHKLEQTSKVELKLKDEEIKRLKNELEELYINYIAVEYKDPELLNEAREFRNEHTYDYKVEDTPLETVIVEEVIEEKTSRIEFLIPLFIMFVTLIIFIICIYNILKSI